MLSAFCWLEEICLRFRNNLESHILRLSDATNVSVTSNGERKQEPKLFPKDKPSLHG